MNQQPSPANLGDLHRRKDAALLFERYAARLIALARHRLDGRLREKVDPEDVLQSVFRSFYRRHVEGQWDIADENGLWHLLVRMTLRKCNRQLEHFLAGRRDVRREAGAADAEQPAIDPEPTPTEAAMLADVTAVLMDRLGTEVKRRVFELSLQGYSVVEISQQLGYYERGVERVRAEIRSRLHAMMADTPPANG